MNDPDATPQNGGVDYHIPAGASIAHENGLDANGLSASLPVSSEPQASSFQPVAFGDQQTLPDVSPRESTSTNAAKKKKKKKGKKKKVVEIVDVDSNGRSIKIVETRLAGGKYSMRINDKTTVLIDDEETAKSFLAATIPNKFQSNPAPTLAQEVAAAAAPPSPIDRSDSSLSPSSTTTIATASILPSTLSAVSDVQSVSKPVDSSVSTSTIPPQPSPSVTTITPTPDSHKKTTAKKKTHAAQQPSKGLVPFKPQANPASTPVNKLFNSPIFHPGSTQTPPGELPGVIHLNDGTCPDLSHAHMLVGPEVARFSSASPRLFLSTLAPLLFMHSEQGPTTPSPSTAVTSLSSGATTTTSVPEHALALTCSDHSHASPHHHHSTADTPHGALICAVHGIHPILPDESARNPPTFPSLQASARSNVQQAIKNRTDWLLSKNEQRTLSMQDIADHKMYMQRLSARLNSRKQSLQKRFRVVTATLQRSHLDSRKRSALSEELGRLLQFERNFNEDVVFYNSELEAFETSPAYRKTIEHVTNDWEDVNGYFVKKKDFPDVSFAAVLEEEKRRQHRREVKKSKRKGELSGDGLDDFDDIDFQLGDDAAAASGPVSISTLSNTTSIPTKASLGSLASLSFLS